jgi:hypothetical protein
MDSTSTQLDTRISHRIPSTLLGTKRLEMQPVVVAVGVVSPANSGNRIGKIIKLSKRTPPSTFAAPCMHRDVKAGMEASKPSTIRTKFSLFCEA